MNVHLVSLGCARNTVDSEVMLGRLTRAGWTVVDGPDDARVIIVNTCSFITPAVDESIDTILALAEYKKKGKCRSLIVTGCLPERFREDLAAELPEVNCFLGAGAFDRIVEAARGDFSPSACLLPDPDGISMENAGYPRILTLPHSAYVKVAEGCSRHCTYCIIPRLRGRMKSRPPEDILAEARKLVDQGVKELVLVAQDTTAYGKDLSGEILLPDLLNRLADLSDSLWIRVLYGHPESIDDKTLRVMAERSTICSYYDLPIQHASDPVLKRMGRGMGRAGLEALFARIRSIDPAACLRTTVIVGFPGETDEDFETLMDFVRLTRFDHLGVFTYSDSEDLPSHGLPRHVSPGKAKKRFDRLMTLQRGISEEIHRKYLGQVLAVLVEEAPEPGVYTGRTRLQAPEVDGIVYIRSSRLEAGVFHPVRITDTLEYDLVGEIP